jgi:hypothetical protein
LWRLNHLENPLYGYRWAFFCLIPLLVSSLFRFLEKTEMLSLNIVYEVSKISEKELIFS